MCGGALADALGPLDQLLDAPGGLVWEAERQAALDCQELCQDPRGWLVPAVPGQHVVQAINRRGETVVLVVAVPAAPFREVDDSLHHCEGSGGV